MNRQPSIAGVPDIPLLRTDRLAIGILGQAETIAQNGQQLPFEAAQYGFHAVALRQLFQGTLVGGEQQWLGIASAQQAHQQFIEIEAAEQYLALQLGETTSDFGLGQGLQVAAANHAHQQRHEGLRGQFAPLAPRTTPDHALQAMVQGEQIDQRAAVPVRATMQDVGRTQGVLHDSVESITQRIQRALVIGPAPAYLDPQIKHDLATEQLLHVETGFLADFLHALAAVTDDDLLLTFTLYQDQGMDMQHLAFLLELFDLDRDLIGNLGTELTHDLLAHQFGGKKARTAVGQLIFGIEMLALGQQPGDYRLQVIDVAPMQRGNRYHL